MKKYIGFFTLLLSGCVSTGDTVEVTGSGDAFEDRIKISTINYSKPFVINPSDHYFIGYIDKKTGIKSYRLYTITNSTEWMHWDSAKALVNGKIFKLPASVISSDAKCSQYGCARYEDINTNLKRETLNQWAASNTQITVRYSSSRASGSADIKIDKTELLSFLAKIDSINLMPGK